MFCIICLLFSSAREASAYTVLTPSPGNRFLIQSRHPSVNMVVMVSGPDEQQGFQVEEVGEQVSSKRIVRPLGRWEENNGIYIHYLLPLRRGENIFLLIPGRRQLRIQYKPSRTMLNLNQGNGLSYLFHRKMVAPRQCRMCHKGQLPSGVVQNAKWLSRCQDFSPVCFSCHQRLVKGFRWRHGPSANIECLGCHKTNFNGRGVTILTERVNELCFKCHLNKRRLKDKSHIHGPAKIGDCTVCHDPHGDKFREQLWANRKADLCVACHSDKKTALKGAPGFYQHGIIPGGGCIACHDAHASNNMFQLYKPINALCVSCHISMRGIVKGHPVAGHPLSGKKDPRRRGRELSCSSCHNPHGSRYRYLLIGDVMGGRVCTKCHH